MRRHVDLIWLWVNHHNFQPAFFGPKWSVAQRLANDCLHEQNKKKGSGKARVQ